MKNVKNPQVGQLVKVPVYQFAPMRSGWNGWIFRVGVIDGLYISTSGKKCAKVRYCSGLAGRYQMLPCKEHTISLAINNVFEWNGLASAQKSYTEFKRYEDDGEQVCWDNDTAFLLNNGYIQ